MKIAGAYLAGADGTRTVVTDRVTLRSVDPVGASTYDAAQLLDNSSDALQPLLPTRVRLAFDVPPSRVRGARLWVSAGRLEWKGDLQAEDWFRPQARVDLGIGKARARELLDSAVRNLSVEEGP